MVAKEIEMEVETEVKIEVETEVETEVEMEEVEIEMEAIRAPFRMKLHKEKSQGTTKYFSNSETHWHNIIYFITAMLAKTIRLIV